MSDYNDQGGVKSPMATISSLRARLAEAERLRADDIEILTGDIRRRDAMINDLRMVMEQTIVKVRGERDAALLRVVGLEWFVQDLADEPCDYGDGCPPFGGTRHGTCLPCKARAASAPATGDKEGA